MAVYLVPPLNPSTWIFHPSTFYPQPLSAPSPDTSLAAPGSPDPGEQAAGLCGVPGRGWGCLPNPLSEKPRQSLEKMSTALPPSQMNHAPRHVVN